MLVVIQTELDKFCFRRFKTVIIGSVNAIEQNKLSYMMARQLTIGICPELLFFQYSMTPTLGRQVTINAGYLSANPEDRV